MNIGDLFLGLRVDPQGTLAADVTKAATAAGTAGGASLGQQISSSVTKYAPMIGAGIGASFAGAVQAGAEFEHQLAIINTVAKLPAESLKGLGDEILALSRETGKGTEDLTQGFYDLVSAGVPAEKAISVLRDSAKFATGALGTTGEAVDLVTSAMNAYGMEAGDSTRITDIFAKAVADGKVTAAELGASISQIAPVAAAAGVSLEEVSAGYAMLTAQGVPAAAAATQMKAAISALLTPNEELNRIQKETGINFTELMKAEGLAVALDTLRDSVAGNEERFAKAVGSMDAYQFALITTGENADEFAQQIVETGEASGLAAEQYDIAASSAVSAGKRLSAEFKSWAIKIGQEFQALGPLFTAFGPTMGRLMGAGLGAIGGLLVKGFAGIVPLLLGQATATGTATGTAQGTAHATAATGQGFITKMLAGMTGMYSKLNASASIAGKAAGLAMGLAMVVGVAAAAAEYDDEISNVGHDMGRTVFGAFGDEAKGLAHGTVADSLTDGIHELWYLVGQIPMTASGQQQYFDKAVHDALANGINPEPIKTAFRAAIAEGMSPEDAYRRAIEVGNAAGTGIVAGIAENTGGAGTAALDGYMALLEGRAVVGGVATARGWAAGQEEQLRADWAANMAGYAETTQAAMIEAHRIAAWGGEQTPGAFSQGLRSAFDTVRSAFSDLKDLMKNTLSPAAQEAELIGIATSKRLAKALADGRPEVRGEGQQIALDTIAQLHRLDATSPEIGRLTTLLLARALPNERPALQAAINAIVGVVTTPLDKLPGIAETAGEDTGAALARGLRNKFGSVTTAAQQLAGIVRGRLELGSPAKEGPWSKNGGPIAWLESAGIMMGLGLVSGIDRSLPDVRRSIGRLSAAGLSGFTAPGFTLPSLGGINGTATLHHTVKLDLENAPPGITNDGVAQIVTRVLDDLINADLNSSDSYSLEPAF